MLWHKSFLNLPLHNVGVASAIAARRQIIDFRRGGEIAARKRIAAQALARNGSDRINAFGESLQLTPETPRHVWPA